LRLTGKTLGVKTRKKAEQNKALGCVRKKPFAPGPSADNQGFLTVLLLFRINAAGCCFPFRWRLNRDRHGFGVAGKVRAAVTLWCVAALGYFTARRAAFTAF
jgi:hypothetical protein